MIGMATVERGSLQGSAGRLCAPNARPRCAREPSSEGRRLRAVSTMTPWQTFSFNGRRSESKRHGVRGKERVCPSAVGEVKQKVMV